MHASNPTNGSSQPRPLWHEVAGRATVTEIDEVYGIGRSDGRREVIAQVARVMNEKSRQNMALSSAFAVRIYEAIRDKGFTVSSIRMRTDEAFDYEVMFVVSVKDFVTDDFLEIMDVAAAVEAEMSNATFSPFAQFLAIDDEGRINTDILYGDGFVYVLDPESST
jgi:hypothetical protein